MTQNKENSWCCGGGGGLKSAYNDLALKIGKNRIKQAEKTGAEILLTSCPTCVWNLRESAKKMQSSIKVIELVTFLHSVT